MGQVPLVSGEIAEDITAYYAVSEQTPTVCALGVLVDRDLSILTAGGYLLQLLPGASDAEITHLEQNVAALPSVTELLRSGASLEQIMEQEGITEELKACDQMEWVRAVNNIRNAAEEIVLKELIYR